MRNNIIICGGFTGNWSSIRCPIHFIEILGENKLRLPPLPKTYDYSCVFVTKEYDILVVINVYIENVCYKFVNGTWKFQSPPNDFQHCDMKSFTMQNGYYIISPREGNSTILSNSQNEWKTGPQFDSSSGDMAKFLAISKSEIVVTGGTKIPSRIFKINVVTQEVNEIGNLKNGRWMHASVSYKGKLIVTGGFNYYNRNFSTGTSTEIIDLESGISRLGGNLNFDRRHHGMGVISKNGKPTLIVFGGEYMDEIGCPMSLDSIEEWDDETETWRISDLKLDIGRHSFDWCSLQEF